MPKCPKMSKSGHTVILEGAVSVGSCHIERDREMLPNAFNYTATGIYDYTFVHICNSVTYNEFIITITKSLHVLFVIVPITSSVWLRVNKFRYRVDSFLVRGFNIGSNRHNNKTLEQSFTYLFIEES